MNALPAEHILLESPDAPLEAVAERAGAVRARFTVHNRIRRVQTELKLYDGGFLGVRVTRADGARAEQRFDLRHVDPKPLLSRRPAAAALRTALGAVAAAAALAGLTYASVASAATLPAAVAALVIGLLAGLAYVYRAEEHARFVTLHGRVAVLDLVASCGCFGACRAVVPKIVAAINDAVRRERGNRNTRLRDEVREHYRLREDGVLRPAECMEAVQRILARFE